VAKASTKSRQKKENAIVRYIKETRAELRKVTWPTRQEAINLTAIVVAVTTAMAAFLGVVDYLFSKLFGLIIR
jgi:preprotein translocase subunit SecE